jgi:hypothetical protein
LAPDITRVMIALRGLPFTTSFEAMPRAKRTFIVRAACALLIICLYFMGINPLRSMTLFRSGGWAKSGDASEVLGYVNMFIGTKNGGMYFAATKDAY